MAKKKTTRRCKESAYELPTEEKRAFGLRMAEARRIAGLEQGEAAKALGYSQAVQLSLMESGKRMPPLRIVIECAKLYGTTTDYLCGLAEDSDRDPVAAVQRHVSSRIAAEVQHMIRQMSAASVDVVRALMPSASDGQRLASLVIEANTGLGRFAQLNPAFEDMPAGAALVRKLQAASDAATRYAAQVDRAKRLMQARPCPGGVTTDAGQQMSLLPVLNVSVEG